jgi:hypothetical protein
LIGEINYIHDAVVAPVAVSGSRPWLDFQDMAMANKILRWLSAPTVIFMGGSLVKLRFQHSVCPVAPSVQNEPQTVICVHLEGRLLSEFFKSSNRTHKVNRAMYEGNRPQYYCCTTTSRFTGVLCEFEAPLLNPFWGFCVGGRD